jgi:hypothetical protein
MKIEVEKTLIEKAIEHLEIAQKESFAYETDFIINDLKKEIDRKKINRNLLVEFYSTYVIRKTCFHKFI